MEKKEKSFEESIEELEAIVKSLESGDIPLDDAINKYNDAMKLSKFCSEKLKNAEEAINKIVKDDDTVEEFKNLDEE